MPRPGPRPYECVRRAWHSDRHHPMRGSLIQEIFRVANEIHSSATKKNKEWLEKLPVVVLKAEEIMYSKANSEAEYMDLKTLYDRANDAINTIIRRDESSETGELLQPCIEAALTLGCTPRKASRSQRNDSPICYLSASNLESIASESPSSIPKQNDHTTNRFPFLSGDFPNMPCLPVEAHQSSNLCSVYPLYYATNQIQLQLASSQFGFSICPNSNSKKSQPVETKNLQALLSSGLDVVKEVSRGDLRDNSENPLGNGCDLSLRLGLVSVPRTNTENSLPLESEDVGSNTSQEGSKSTDLNVLVDKDFSFFPKANDPLDSCSSKKTSEDENLSTETRMRKRKMVKWSPLLGQDLPFPP
ncbi:hypothetical protein NMG60_11000930 [Bertholletia excelsa]